MKFHLEKFENHLIFQVLDQEKDFKSWSGKIGDIDVRISKPNLYPTIEISGDDGRICFNHGVSFEESKESISRLNGDIVDLKIYVRGKKKTRNNDVLIIPFKNNSVRDKIYDTIIESFKKRSHEV